MKIESVSEAEIWNEINNSFDRMTSPQRKLWDVIKIIPVKWSQRPYGDDCDGFWVVAIYGDTVIWYNEIEEGFNRSSYAALGDIKEYWCNQDNLEWTVQHVLDEIKSGYFCGGLTGPPQPIDE